MSEGQAAEAQVRPRGTRLPWPLLAVALVQAMQNGRTQREVAADFNTVEEVICRLKKKPRFAALLRAELDRALGEARQIGSAHLCAAVPEAYHALRAELRRDDGDRVRAARTLLELAGLIGHDGGPASMPGGTTNVNVLVANAATNEDLTQRACRIFGEDLARKMEARLVPALPMDAPKANGT